MLVMLDRDGVINHDSADYVKSPDEWHAIDGSLEAIARLNQAGHNVVVVTNQSGIARKYFDLDTLEAMHQKMLYEAALLGGRIDAIFFCPHGPDDHCACRKPKAGLLLQAANKFNAVFSDAVLVGDSYRDLQAAQTVDCQAVLVKTGKGLQTLEKHASDLVNVPVYDDLATFVDVLLAKGSVE